MYRAILLCRFNRVLSAGLRRPGNLCAHCIVVTYTSFSSANLLIDCDTFQELIVFTSQAFVVTGCQHFSENRRYSTASISLKLFSLAAVQLNVWLKHMQVSTGQTYIVVPLMLIVESLELFRSSAINHFCTLLCSPFQTKVLNLQLFLFCKQFLGVL